MSRTPDGVPKPRFPERRENFGASRTFKADIGLLNICMAFQDPGLKWWSGGQIGEGMVRY